MYARGTTYNSTILAISPNKSKILKKEVKHRIKKILVLMTCRMRYATGRSFWVAKRRISVTLQMMLKVRIDRKRRTSLQED